MTDEKHSSQLTSDLITTYRSQSTPILTSDHSSYITSQLQLYTIQFTISCSSLITSTSHHAIICYAFHIDLETGVETHVLDQTECIPLTSNPTFTHTMSIPYTPGTRAAIVLRLFACPSTTDTTSKSLIGHTTISLSELILSSGPITYRIHNRYDTSCDTALTSNHACITLLVKGKHGNEVVVTRTMGVNEMYNTYTLTLQCRNIPGYGKFSNLLPVMALFTKSTSDTDSSYFECVGITEAAKPFEGSLTYKRQFLLHTDPYTGHEQELKISLYDWSQEQIPSERNHIATSHIFRVHELMDTAHDCLVTFDQTTCTNELWKTKIWVRATEVLGTPHSRTNSISTSRRPSTSVQGINTDVATTVTQMMIVGSNVRMFVGDEQVDDVHIWYQPAIDGKVAGIYWSPITNPPSYTSSTHIPLSSITSLHAGKLLRPFQIHRSALMVHPDHCLSITSKDGIAIHVEMDTANVRNAWIFGLLHVMKQSKHPSPYVHIQSASDAEAATSLALAEVNIQSVASLLLALPSLSNIGLPIPTSSPSSIPTSSPSSSPTSSSRSAASATSTSRAPPTLTTSLSTDTISPSSSPSSSARSHPTTSPHHRQPSNNSTNSSDSPLTSFSHSMSLSDANMSMPLLERDVSIPVAMSPSQGPHRSGVQASPSTPAISISPFVSPQSSPAPASRSLNITKMHMPAINLPASVSMGTTGRPPLHGASTPSSSRIPPSIILNVNDLKSIITSTPTPPHLQPSEWSHVTRHFEHLIYEGRNMIRYRAKAAAQFVTVFYRRDGNTDGWIYWSTVDDYQMHPSRRIALRSITAIVLDRQATVLQRDVAAYAPEGTCMSILSPTRNLHLQLKHQSQRDVWAYGLCALAQSLGHRITLLPPGTYRDARSDYKIDTEHVAEDDDVEIKELSTDDLKEIAYKHKMFRIELLVRCKNLPSKGTQHVVCMFDVDAKTDKLKYLQQTERIPKSQHPEFRKKLILDTEDNPERRIRLNLYDLPVNTTKIEDQYRLGSMAFKLKEVVDLDGIEFVFLLSHESSKLENALRKYHSIIIVRCTKKSELESNDDYNRILPIDTYDDILIQQLQNMMEWGRSFALYNEQQIGTTKSIYIRGDAKTGNATLYWCEASERIEDPAHSLPVASIQDVFAGRGTSRSFPIEVADECCLSIVSNTGLRLDLAAKTPKQRDAWVVGLAGLLKSAGVGVNLAR